MRWVAATLLIGAAVLAWFLFVRAPEVTNYPSSGADIVALGDSLVYGTGATKGSDFVSVLSNKVGQPIINLGNPGDTTEDVLDRLHELDRYDPKVVILLAGGNDYLRRVPDEEVFANLSQIIKELHARGSMVLLVGIHGGLVGDRYEPQFEALAKEHKTAYVPDALQGLLGRGEYMADTVHPNSMGYALLAERIAPTLQGLLQ